MKTAKDITERINAWKRGKIFFLSDFADLDNQVAVRKQLSRLCAEKAEHMGRDWLDALSSRLSSVTEECFSHDVRLLSQQTRSIVLSCRKILS